jgi:hypothetical protein
MIEKTAGTKPSVIRSPFTLALGRSHGQCIEMHNCG